MICGGTSKCTNYCERKHFTLIHTRTNTHIQTWTSTLHHALLHPSVRCTCSHAQGCTLRCATRGYLTVPYRTHPGAQISEILKVIPGTTDPVNKYFSLPCTNPGGHLAQPVPEQVFVCMRAHARCACACVLVRLCLHMYVSVSEVSTHRCSSVRSPLIAVQPPSKLYFRQTPETPEPLNKYIFYDTDITPEGKTVICPGWVR